MQKLLIKKIVIGRKCFCELPWIQRDYVYYVYYCPLLDNGNILLLGEIFDTNTNTLKGWIFKGQMIMKLLSLEKYLVVLDNISIIPVNKKEKIELAGPINRL